ncbi:uncharacterized protein SPPG_04445 [Spizellomyces punctatus DAOM BR117]|uniref:Uncharacterized protein n=1 Tax=Spizellomyces punctatus (strain DAOM BR117) TaxID=645134 RepID=A0A0L0HGA3_SPIPD|nr:uncharacterized protein SPPG_04445 [Spizellomyces punctatus DAOM BR117]KND00103.1 hypothetical protein SPPG_04445 [Spizellomyces punctatus DAOM BR117]|eukprot:XP_016608142.1 hypothetical protein SPPG_04445 [Spizellomyces punctatus DAOM BR117]
MHLRYHFASGIIRKYLFERVKRANFSINNFLKFSARYVDLMHTDALRYLEDAFQYAVKRAIRPSMKRNLSARQDTINSIRSHIQMIKKGQHVAWNAFFMDTTAERQLEAQTNRRHAAIGERLTRAAEAEDGEPGTLLPVKRSRPDSETYSMIETTKRNRQAPVEEVEVESGLPEARAASQPMGSKFHFIVPPTGGPFETPYKGKLATHQLKALANNVHVVLCNTISRSEFPDPVRARFNAYRSGNSQRASLCQLPNSYKALKELLAGNQGWDGWARKVWAYQLPDDTGELDCLFWDICCYGLTTAHEKLCAMDRHWRDNDHERTAWIDYIIPWFAPLRITKLIDWQWCEFHYTARNLNVLSDEEEYSSRSKRYADGVGFDPDNREEKILMESSSGTAKEDVSHAMDDALKLVENSKRKIMGVQCVVDTVRLTYTTIGEDPSYWEVYEVRSAKVPQVWGKKALMIGMLELIATVFLELYAQQEVTALMDDELINGVDLEETVRHILKI